MLRLILLDYFLKNSVVIVHYFLEDWVDIASIDFPME